MICIKSFIPQFTLRTLMLGMTWCAITAAVTARFGVTGFTTACLILACCYFAFVASAGHASSLRACIQGAVFTSLIACPFVFPDVDVDVITWAALLAMVVIGDMAGSAWSYIILVMSWAAVVHFMLFGVWRVAINASMRFGFARSCGLCFGAFLGLAPMAYTLIAIRSLDSAAFWQVYGGSQGRVVVALHFLALALQTAGVVCCIRSMWMRTKDRSLTYSAMLILINTWAALAFLYPMTDFL